MIKLTETQRQTAVALANLTKAAPSKMFFTAEEVRNERLRELDKEERGQTYYRTTQNALRQLHKLVPTLTTSNAVGWRLTAVGLVLARSQLGVEL